VYSCYCGCYCGWTNVSPIVCFSFVVVAVVVVVVVVDDDDDDDDGVVEVLVVDVAFPNLTGQKKMSSKC
jgi:hypothetical protein